MMHSKKMVLAQGVGPCRSPGAAGLKKAIVALARRLAVIMHRIWVGRPPEFRWTREQATAAA